MAQAFLETDIFLRRAAPAPARTTTQTGSRPAFTLDDPKAAAPEAANPSRDTRSRPQRAERDRPDAASASDRTDQARTDQARTDQAKTERPAPSRAAVADAASSEDTTRQTSDARRAPASASDPTAPRTPSEATDAGTGQVEANAASTDETQDESDVSDASTEDQDITLLGLFQAQPPIPPRPQPVPGQSGQAAPFFGAGPAGQVQGGSAQAASATGTAKVDLGQPSSGAVQAQAGAVPVIAGQVASAMPGVSNADGTDQALVSPTTDATQLAAGTALSSKDVVPGSTDPSAITQPKVADAGPFDPAQLGLAPPLGAAQPPEGAPPAAGQALVGLAMAASSGAKSDPKPAGKPGASTVSVQGVAGAAQAPKGVPNAAAGEATAASASATVGKSEAASSGKSDPAVAVQEVAGNKDAAGGPAVMPMPDAPHHAAPETFDAHLAGVAAGAATAATSGTAAPAAQATQTPVPASPPIPLGAVPMTIGLRSLQGSNHFEIRLDPGDLGRIDVRLDIDKERGTVMAHLVVDRIETLALLQRDAGSLQQALSQAGLDASEANINLSLRSDTQSGGRGAEDQGSDGRRPDGGSGSGRLNQPEGRAALEAIPLRTLSGLTGLDIRI